jgi:hypothetical protein
MPTDRGRTVPTNRRRAVSGVAFLLVGAALALGLSACSNTTTAVTETVVTVPIDGTPCALVTASQINTAMGTTVTSPTASVHGSVTLCSYQASSLGKSVIISYDSKSGPSKFAKNRAVLRTQGDKVGKILGLGDEAYYAVATSKGTTVNTVVARRGSHQVLVTSTAGSLSDLEVVAEEALAAVSPSSTTTTTTAPSPTTAAG